MICAAMAVKNSALVRIQLSTLTSVPRAQPTAAMRSAANGSRTLTSIAGDAAGEVEQALRGAQRDEDGARVDALVAEIEHAGHRERVVAPPTPSTSRSLSPTSAPRSFASSMPMMMSVGPRSWRPATIFWSSAMTWK